MAKRFIDAEELELEYYDLSIHGTIAVKSVLPIFADLLEKQPTADVVEIRHGHWEVCSDEYEICASEFVCSVCKESFCSSELTDEQFFEMMQYCPHCGARMDGDENDL